MHVPEIIKVKQEFADLKEKGVVAEWELPYENLLTRLTAAIFFFTPRKDDVDNVLKKFSSYENFSMRANTEQKLSKLTYRVTFSKEEKEKNANALQLGKVAQN